MKKLLRNILPWVDIDKKIFKRYRKSRFFYKNGLKQIAKYISYRIYIKFNCIIPPESNIHDTVKLPHPTGIVIGEGVKIGKQTVIYQNVTIGRKYKDVSKYPSIGNNVTIYANSTIIGDVKIGDNAIIGCNSVVLRNVEPGEKVSGIVK